MPHHCWFLPILFWWACLSSSHIEFCTVYVQHNSIITLKLQKQQDHIIDQWNHSHMAQIIYNIQAQHYNVCGGGASYSGTAHLICVSIEWVKEKMSVYYKIQRTIVELLV